MAIDFPNSPVAGNSYTYAGVTYIYHTDGYWAVLTSGTTGVASSAEINEGTDNSKYISPQGLNGSKYVREDEVTEDTTLTTKGVERLRTTETGVALTGKLVLDGDTEKGGVKVGLTELYDGGAGAGVIVPLPTNLTLYDELKVQTRDLTSNTRRVMNILDLTTDSNYKETNGGREYNILFVPSIDEISISDNAGVNLQIQKIWAIKYA